MEIIKKIFLFSCVLLLLLFCCNIFAQEKITPDFFDWFSKIGISSTRTLDKLNEIINDDDPFFILGGDIITTIPNNYIIYTKFGNLNVQLLQADFILYLKFLDISDLSFDTFYFFSGMRIGEEDENYSWQKTEGLCGISIKADNFKVRLGALMNSHPYIETDINNIPFFSNYYNEKENKYETNIWKYEVFINADIQEYILNAFYDIIDYYFSLIQFKKIFYVIQNEIYNLGFGPNVGYYDYGSGQLLPIGVDLNQKLYMGVISFIFDTSLSTYLFDFTNPVFPIIDTSLTINLFKDENVKKDFYIKIKSALSYMSDISLNKYWGWLFQIDIENSLFPYIFFPTSFGIGISMNYPETYWRYPLNNQLLIYLKSIITI